MRRGAIPALACAACAAAMPPASASALPFKPRVGKYSGTVPGVYSANKITLEVLRRHRTFRTRVLKLSDDCAGGLLPAPVGLGRVFAKDIKYEAAGTSGTLTWGLKIEGVFTGPRRATIRVRSYQNDPAPPPGSPPSATTVCRDDTTFTVKHLKPKK